MQKEIEPCYNSTGGGELNLDTYNDSTNIEQETFARAFVYVIITRVCVCVCVCHYYVIFCECVRM